MYFHPVRLDIVGRMSLQLSLAARANQAELLPVLLVATSINAARPQPVINITFEDTALLHEGEKAIVQFTGASGTPVYGAEKSIGELRANFPFLTSKDEKLVRLFTQMHVSQLESCLLVAEPLTRKTNGFLSCTTLPLRILRLLSLSSSAWMPTLFSGPLLSGTRCLLLTLLSGVLSVVTVLGSLPFERVVLRMFRGGSASWKSSVPGRLRHWTP